MEYYFETLHHPTVTVNGKNLNFESHLHHEVEIITVVNGILECQINGNHQFLQSGDCALIQPNMIHSYRSHSQTRSMLTIFNPALTPSYKKALHSTAYLTQFVQNIDKDFLYAANKLSELSPSDDDQNLIKGYLYIMLAILTSRLQPARGTIDGADYFQKLLIFVNQHFDQPITAKETAKKHGITYEHLSRLYKEKLGLTFSEHIRLLRISKAKTMLSETSMSISGIAASCGYDNDRTFYRAFKAITGTTPYQFRKNMDLPSADTR